MKRIVLFIGLTIALAACVSASQPATTVPTSVVLPQHTVAKDTAITNGRRIEIHVSDPSLTKDECLALIVAYRDKAKPQGQISVRKPDKTGELVPWCVDNMDGSPVIFNDSFFK